MTFYFVTNTTRSNKTENKYFYLFFYRMTDHCLNGPFKNRDESYKALQIVHRTFSQKLLNYDHVTHLVNIVIGTNLSKDTKIKFVEQVR
jgi:hypothetical protein